MRCCHPTARAPAAATVTASVLCLLLVATAVPTAAALVDGAADAAVPVDGAPPRAPSGADVDAAVADVLAAALAERDQVDAVDGVVDATIAPSTLAPSTSSPSTSSPAPSTSSPAPSASTTTATAAALLAALTDPDKAYDNDAVHVEGEVASAPVAGAAQVAADGRPPSAAAADALFAAAVAGVEPGQGLTHSSTVETADPAAADALFAGAVADVRADAAPAATAADSTDQVEEASAALAYPAAADALFAAAASDLEGAEEASTGVADPATAAAQDAAVGSGTPSSDAAAPADNAPLLTVDASTLLADPSTTTNRPMPSFTPAFTVAATFGTVPDADALSAPTFRGADVAVDGDAVYLSLQDGGKNWRASVFRVDGTAPRPVGGSPGYTPGPAVDLVIAAAGGTLATAYREGVYHHGYYREGDDSWVYVAPGGGRFVQAGAPFTNARPRGLSLVLDPASRTPVVAYADDEYEGRATVRALASSGEWPTLGDQGLSKGAVSGVRLVVDPASPSSASPSVSSFFIAYNDATCGDRVTVKRYTAGAWTDVGAACFSNDKAAGISLTAIPGKAGAPSSPCVAYGDSGTGVVSCYVDSSWRTVGGRPFSSTRTMATSIAYDRTRPALFVSYRDGGYGGRVSVSRFDAGGGWTSVGPRGFGDTEVWRTRLAVTASGSVYVAAEIGGGDGSTDGVVLYKMK